MAALWLLLLLLHSAAGDTANSTILINDCTCGGQVDAVMVCQGTCDRFPNYRIQQTELQVTKTDINTIYIGDLSNLQHLKSLSIDHNSRLSNIKPGVFLDMYGLEYLSISFNLHLGYLASGVFEGLHNLTELKLISNRFTNIASIVETLRPNYLPSLLKLWLNKNPFSRIEQYDLTPLNGTDLEEIHLRLCELEYIHPKAVRVFRNLRHLDFSQNLLNETTLTKLIRQMTRDNITLYSLELDLMEFQNPPKILLTAIGESGIKSLGLERNKFPSLRIGSFPKMHRLEYLSLRYCSMIDIEPGTFDAAYFPQLKQLNLAQNQLNGIYPGMLPTQITELDISWNSYNDENPVDFILGEGNFINMTSLTTLNISYVRLETISPKTFSGLGNMTGLLGLKNASVTRLEPGSFLELGKLTFLSLENNPFPSHSELSADIFEGLNSLEILVLKGCGISNFNDVNVFSPLQKLKYLLLDSNQIVVLNPKVLLPLRNLEGFSINNNELQSWADEPLFKHNPNLSSVFLSSNKLTYLSYVMLEDFSPLQQLTLYNNMFICDCAALEEFEQWKKSGNEAKLEYISSSPDSGPYCEAPENWKSRKLTTFLHSTYEKTCPSRFITAIIWSSIVLSLLLLVAIVLGALGYKYRSHIRYWIFLARMDLRRRGVSRYKGRRKVFSEGCMNYQYDAFVSYSNEDRNFVVRLVAMLENYEPFLKLCVYERDFEIGTVISEAVLESVAASRRSLLIVSDAFARSQWCMWELSLAEHHRLYLGDTGEDRDDSLIIIKLGHVRSSNMTPTLKYLMRTRIYLEWDQDPKKQRVFWEKLRSTLTPPAVKIKSTT